MKARLFPDSSGPAGVEAAFRLPCIQGAEKVENCKVGGWVSFSVSNGNKGFPYLLVCSDFSMEGSIAA